MGSAVIPPPPGFELDDEFVPPPPGFELDSVQPPVAPSPVHPPRPRVADPFGPEQSWIREQAAAKPPSFNSPVKDPSPVVRDRPGPEAVRPMAPTSIPPTVTTTPVGRSNAPVPGRIPGMERLGGAAPGVPPVTAQINETSAPSLAGDVGGGFVRGVASGAMAVPRALSRIPGGFRDDINSLRRTRADIEPNLGFRTPEQVAEDEARLRQISGSDINRFEQAALPAAPVSGAGKFAEALGSTAPYMAAGVAGPAGPAALGILAGTEESLGRSDASGIQMSDTQRLSVGAAGAAIGSTEALPFGRLLGRLKGAGVIADAVDETQLVKQLFPGLKDYAVSAGKQALEEGIQEGTSSILQDATEASYGGRPVNRIGEGLGESVKTGGGVGALVDVLTTLAGSRAGRARLSQNGVDPAALMAWVQSQEVSPSMTAEFDALARENRAPSPPQAAPVAAPTPNPAESPAPPPPQQAEVAPQVPPPPPGFTVDPLPDAIESAPEVESVPSSEASETPAPVKQDRPAWALDVQPTKNVDGVWTEHPSTRSIIASAEQELIDRGRITSEDIPALRRQAGDKVENGAQHGEAYARVLQAYLQGAVPKLDQPSPVPAPGPREEVVQPVPVDAAAPVAEVNPAQEPNAPIPPQATPTPSAVEAAAPEAQPPAAPKEPPAGVAASVKRYLDTIADVNRQLAEARTVDDKFGGEGRYENEVWDRLMGEGGAVTAEASKKLQVFRDLAVKNGVDAEAFIEKMGWMPESPALSDRAKKYRGEASASVPPSLESPGERSEAKKPAAVEEPVAPPAPGETQIVDRFHDAYKKLAGDGKVIKLADVQREMGVDNTAFVRMLDELDRSGGVTSSGENMSLPASTGTRNAKNTYRSGDTSFYGIQFSPAEQPKDFQWNGPVPNFENFKGREPNSAPSAPPPADSKIVYGKKSGTAKLSRGYSVPFTWAVVPAESMVLSNEDNGDVNKRFPQEMQPRQRDRAASEMQIQGIADKLDPEQVAESYVAGDGAPFIFDDMAVESGNGRGLAIRRAYRRKMAQAEAYRNWLENNAERFGLSTADVMAIENPVLVRVRTGLPEGVSRQDFARDANEDTKAQMAEGEQAMVDAKSMSDELVSMFMPNETGEIATRANFPFILRFIEQVVPEGQRGAMQLPNKSISKNGIDRIRNAIFARAYNDRGIVERLAEDPDDNIKSVVGGLTIAAPKIIWMRSGIEAGDFHDLDISPEISAAAARLSYLRENRIPLSDYLNQMTLEPRDPIEDALLTMFNGYGRSSANVAEVLGEYVDAVQALGNPKQESMFGESAVPTKLELLGAIVEDKRARDEAAKREKQQRKAEREANPAGGLDAEGGPEGVGAGEGSPGPRSRAKGESEVVGYAPKKPKTSAIQRIVKEGIGLDLQTGEVDKNSVALKFKYDDPYLSGALWEAHHELGRMQGLSTNEVVRAELSGVFEDFDKDYRDSLSGLNDTPYTGIPDIRKRQAEIDRSWADRKAAGTLKSGPPPALQKPGVDEAADGFDALPAEQQDSIAIARLKADGYNEADIADVLDNFEDRDGMTVDEFTAAVKSNLDSMREDKGEVVQSAPAAGSVAAKPPSNGSRGKKSAPPPAGPRTGTAVSRSEIVKNLSSFLNNIPIRTGGFRERAAGIFKVRQNVIRTAKALDLETISHEIGHAIHKYLWGTRKGSLVALNLAPLRPFRNELGLLDYDQTKKRAYEGFAEYIRLRVTKPAEAKQRAPKFHAWFNQKLGDAPELADVLKKAQEQYLSWDIQPSTVKLAKSIDTKPNHETFMKRVTDGLSDFRYNWIDDKTGLRDAVELFQKLGATVADTANAYRLARTLSGTFTRANFAITDKTVGADNAPNGAGLGEILKPIADRDVSERNPAFQKLVDDWGINLANDGMDDFRVYIVARRLLDYRDKGLETGFTLQELKRAVADTVTPAVKAAAEELHEYSGRILDYAYEKGAMTEETREAIRSKNEFYVPLHRVMDNVSAEDAKAMLGRKMLDLNSPVLKRKGSTREIIDPLESVIKNTYAIMSFADRNAVSQALVKQADRVSDQGYLVESGIVNPMKATTFNLKEVSKDIMAALEEAGIDGSELELDHMSTIFRPNMDPRRSNGVVRVIVDGIPKLFQMDKNLIRALDNTDAQQADLFKKMAANAAASLRFGATAGNPEFILTNFFRDQGIAGIQSRNGYLPIISGMWGAFKMLSDKKAFQEWQLAGGATAAMMPLTRKNLRLTVDKVTKSKKDLVLTHPAQIFPLMRDALTFFGEKSEASTRFAEYLLAKGKGKTTAEAVFDSRDVSLDFERMGKIAKTVNQFVPFFSVALNAADRFVEMHNPRNKKQFAQSLAKGLLGITIPTMMLWLMNKDDEEYKKIEAWKRDLFWLIPTKYFGLREEFGPFIRIPKPPMWGQLYGSFFERLADSLYSKNKHAFDDFEKTAFQTLVPPASIQAIKPIEEVMSNYNAFTDRPIETEFMKKLSPANRYTPTTSELSKGISKVIGGSLSPVQVEHLLLGYTAGLGRIAITAGEELSGLRKDRPAMEPSERPFIRAFATPSSPYLSTNFKLFKERLEKLKQKQEDFKFSKDPKYRMTSAEESKLAEMEDINESVNEIRSKQFKVYGNKALSRDEKRRQINLMNKQRDEILKRTKPLYD